MNKMQTIVVQVHRVPKSGADATVEVFRRLLQSLVPESKLQCMDDADEGYVNLQFKSNNMVSTWFRVLEELAKDSATFDDLKRRWIVVAQGPHGWEDYKIIAHHDPSVQIDDIS